MFISTPCSLKNYGNSERINEETTKIDLSCGAFISPPNL